ncbi:MAG: cation-binding protein [bacterium]|nr:cation-binding protein [bacterium]
MNTEKLDVTALLVREHDLIEKYLKILERLAKQAIGNPNDEEVYQTAPRVLDFIREFADKIHHGKEEQVLFNRITQPGVLGHCNPVPQMLFEHDEGRNHVKAMNNALEEKNLSVFSQHARAFVELLRLHIHKENNILYPMAEQSLSEEQKNEIQKAYQKVDAELNTAELQKEFESNSEQ